MTWKPVMHDRIPYSKTGIKKKQAGICMCHLPFGRVFSCQMKQKYLAIIIIFMSGGKSVSSYMELKNTVQHGVGINILLGHFAE